MSDHSVLPSELAGECGASMECTRDEKATLGATDVVLTESEASCLDCEMPSTTR
ncbi:hypothetical protein PC128_g13056 [Phytophthora cactorum]|nr:hypothetical protein PC128_g13056 [Phytophthora cactorum]